MSGTGTGHTDFDRCKEIFSAIVRDIESAMHKQAADSNNINNADRSLSQSIRKASSILTNMSSIVKNVTDTEQPALKQELLDIYKACKMQLKTYKLLHAQIDLFQNSKTHSKTTASIEKNTSERDILFAASATANDSSEHNKSGSNVSSSTKNIRDQITSNTQGRLTEQNSRLRDALRSIRESDQIAQEISGELEGQRETLKTARDRLDQFSSLTEHSKNLLNSMNKPWWRKW